MGIIRDGGFVPSRAFFRDQSNVAATLLDSLDPSTDSTTIATSQTLLGIYDAIGYSSPDSLYDPLSRVRDITVPPFVSSYDPLSRIRDIATPAAAAFGLSPPRGAINFKDNILSNFESATYKWTLYAGHPRVHNERNWSGAGNVVIIAESGASGDFHLTDIELTTYVGINDKTRYMPHTQFTFSLEEPLGASFMDHIAETAEVVLGSPNHLKIPYFLELSFYGDNGHINVINQNLVWSISITKMNMNTTETGSIYTFEAISVDDMAVTDQIAITPGVFTLENVGTVGEALTALQEKWNANENVYAGVLYQHPDQYMFEPSPDIAALSLAPNDVSNESLRHSLDADGKIKEINIPAAMDISEVFANLMVMTEEWDIYVNRTEYDGGQPAIVEFSKLWKMETQAEYGDFDFFRNDYQKTYIFNIIPYTVLRTNKNRNDAERIRRAAELDNVFHINKLYDYIYTGENTEVLNFDFNLDYMWYQELPYGLEQLRIDGADSDNESFVETATAQQRSIATLQEVIDSGNAGSALNIIQLEIQNAQAAFFSLVNPVTGLSIGSTLALAEDARASLEAGRVNLGGRETFIEDIPLSRRYEHSPSERVTKRRTNITQGFGFEGRLTHTQNAIAQYMSFHGAAEMTQVSLEIKGDPYWMGINKYMRERSIAGGITQSNINVADYMYQDNMFVIRMNTPDKADDTGLAAPINNRLYTALYQVISATHKFQNGLYTTSLNAIKDSQTDITELLKGH